MLWAPSLARNSQAASDFQGILWSGESDAPCVRVPYPMEMGRVH